MLGFGGLTKTLTSEPAAADGDKIMYDWQIELLQRVLQEKKFKVFYDLAGEWVTVSKIGSNVEEDGPVAYIQKGIGHCIALYNCNASDFYVGKPLV